MIDAAEMRQVASRAQESGPTNDSAESLEQAEKTLKEEMKVHTKFSYNYSDYLSAWILQLCCCCCTRSSFYERKRKRYESYHKAKGTLDAELDMPRLLNAIRLTEFISKLTLKSY